MCPVPLQGAVVPFRWFDDIHNYFSFYGFEDMPWYIAEDKQRWKAEPRYGNGVAMDTKRANWELCQVKAYMFAMVIPKLTRFGWNSEAKRAPS